VRPAHPLAVSSARRALSAELTDAELDRLADRLAPRLAALLAETATPASTPPPSGPLVDAATLAAELGVSRQTVYAHGAELGGERVGSAKRARWRFDVEAARAAMAGCASNHSQGESPNVSGDPAPPRRRRTRRLPNGLPPAGSILTRRPGPAA